MARKTRKRPAPVAGSRHYQSRDVLRAGLGAVSLGRKQVIAAYATGFEGILDLGVAAEISVKQAVKRAGKAVSGKVVALRRRAAPLQKQVAGLVRETRASINQRLAPVLVKLGVKKAASKRAPARRTPVARRRKAA